MKPASLVATVLFSAVALLHLLRVIFGVPMVIGDWTVPIWASIGGIVVPAAVAYALWREGRGS